jgi:sodium-independent sulfate anion transporter 11
MVSRTQVGHVLAKVLGIKLDNSNRDDPVTRGESVFSVTSADTYVEEEPTIWDWFAQYTPSLRDIGLYIYHLFPFIHWIGRYNLQWLYGDLVAGNLNIEIL